MFSKYATNQPKSIVELVCMCPKGLNCPPAVTLTKLLKYKKRLLLRCRHHLSPDFINNIDHVRISGTEPSTVILSLVFICLGYQYHSM